jgi:hypothetical protein
VIVAYIFYIKGKPLIAFVLKCTQGITRRRISLNVVKTVRDIALGCAGILHTKV